MSYSPPLGFEDQEVRLTPWVDVCPDHVFDEHSRQVQLPCELRQWWTTPGGADFVLQVGADQLFWIFTRILGLADNDPLVFQSSLLSSEVNAILAPFLPPVQAPPLPTPPSQPTDRKRPLATSSLEDAMQRRPPPAARRAAPSPVNQSPVSLQYTIPIRPPPCPLSRQPLPRVELSSVPLHTLRGYLDHFIRREPSLFTARMLDVYRPGPLEAVSDAGCLELMMDVAQRDAYVNRTLLNIFPRHTSPRPPTPLTATSQPHSPPESGQYYVEEPPTPPPTTPLPSIPTFISHELSFAKEVNRVRQAIKWTASKRANQVLKNFDNLVGAFCRTVTSSSHPTTKLNLVLALIEVVHLAVNTGGEIQTKLLDQKLGSSGIHTAIRGLRAALGFMTMEARNSTLPQIKKFQSHTLEPRGLGMVIGDLVGEIERGEVVSSSGRA
ncbi:hypothetical protein P7C70_g5654, partial [Phenoliferia sp. Uapishka_3]